MSVHRRKRPLKAAFTASLYAGSLGGISLGLLLVALASLPLCCGVLKEHSKVPLRFTGSTMFKLQLWRLGTFT